MTDSIRQLYASMRAVLDAAVPAEHRATFEPAMTRLVAEPAFADLPPQSRDVTDEWLAAALAAEAPKDRAGLHQAARAALPQLRWQTSYTNLPPSPGLAAFQDDYSWAPLAGDVDGAAVPVDRTLVGFTLQAPHITYPGHHHEPVEIYGIMSGKVEWKLGDGDWQLKQPGDVIVHRSHELHAMRTLDEPCLTWVAWAERNQDLVYMPSLDPPGARMDPISY